MYAPRNPPHGTQGEIVNYFIFAYQENDTFVGDSERAQQVTNDLLTKLQYNPKKIASVMFVGEESNFPNLDHHKNENTFSARKTIYMPS